MLMSPYQQSNNEMNEKKKAIFVKYPLCLSYLFSPTETRFIIHMIDAEFLRSKGYNINWSRSNYIKKMGLTEYSFDNAVKKMTRIGLLTKTNNKQGNRVFYSFDMERYNKLIMILSTTRNIDKVIRFFDRIFEKENRTIESVTEEEIAMFSH